MPDSRVTLERGMLARWAAVRLCWTTALLVASCGPAPTEHQAPTLLFLIDPPRILLGESATLSWSVTNATACAASVSPGSGGGAWTGGATVGASTLRVTPTLPGTYSYALTCAGPGGVATDTRQLVVDAPPPPAGVLGASATDVRVGQAVQLTWAFSHATACQASGAWNGPRLMAGNETVTADTAGDLVYTLTCNGPLASVTVSVTVTATQVILPAPTVSLAIDPDHIVLGESATLTWSSAHVIACGASASPAPGSGGWSGTLPTSNAGGQQVTPTVPGVFSYTLTCDGPGGEAKSSRQLQVAAPPPPAGTLTASAAMVVTGQSVVLTWAFTHASGCQASGAWNGTKPLEGSETVTVAAAGDLTFSLTCTGAVQTVTASVAVTGLVKSAPLIATFSPNAVTISTSEGAPYGDSDVWVSPLYAESAFGYGPTRVTRLYVCLSGMVVYYTCSSAPPPTGPLSAAMLDALEARIASYAHTGIRLLIRFTYNFGPIGPGAADVPAALIVTHIDQVAPILLRHRDLIFALEAGFIGTWGEWHSSTSGNDTPPAHKVVLDRELLHFRGAFPILLRHPADLLAYAGTPPPRIDFGLHDDYYASGPTDAGTWIPKYGYTTPQLQAYAAAVSAGSMFVSEFGALDPVRQSCAALDQYSFTYHLQSTSLRLWPQEVADNLVAQGCALSFLNKAGTRIELQDMTMTGEAVPGGTLHFEVTLRNAGYGRVIRARPATVVLSAGGSVLRQTPLLLSQLDLRVLASSAAPVPVRFGFDLLLPGTLPPGTLSVSLVIPDPAPSLSADPAYALPFNSVDAAGNPVFDSRTGWNQLARFVHNQVFGLQSELPSTAVGGRRMSLVTTPRPH